MNSTCGTATSPSMWISSSVRLPAGGDSPALFAARAVEAPAGAARFAALVVCERFAVAERAVLALDGFVSAWARVAAAKATPEPRARSCASFLASLLRQLF